MSGILIGVGSALLVNGLVIISQEDGFRFGLALTLVGVVILAAVAL